MNISIQNNLLAMNANRQYKINTVKYAKTTEKTSSGYRINRAADDASGLAISEKMRRQIRGLNQGTLNARDGISWVQTGDGTLNEAHEILHRMTQLSVKSLNETCTDDDREMMQAEFDQLQSEIDKLTDSATFNQKHIFQEHENPYYQFEGSAVWLQDQRHVITDGANDLTVEYRILESDAPTTKTITVPAGVYTTQALIDEIDTALENAGLIEEGVVLEYTGDGRCNLNLEGGEKIDNVSGGLSYLLYDSFGGGSLGALIGTTIFQTENSRLPIAAGYNDEMSFTVVNTDGSSHPVSIKIPAGNYNRDELLTILQDELDKTPGNTVKATKHGTGIRLASEESIITGFKGNMFKIDTGEYTYTSVFYDNVQESEVRFTPGKFTGAAILPTPYHSTGSQYPENQLFDIRKGVNDTLVLKPNGATQETVITIPEKQYNMSEMVAFLNGQMTSLGLKVSQYSNSNGNFQGITIESTEKGITSAVGFIPEKCTAYETLFVRHSYKVPDRGAAYDNETKADVTALLKSGSNYVVDGVSTLPLNIVKGTNDQFKLTLNNTSTYIITLDAVEYKTADAIRAAINEQLNGSSAPSGYKGLLEVSLTADNKILLQGNRSVDLITVGKVDGNSGYEDIFVGQKKITQYSPPQHTTVTNTNAILPDGTVKVTSSQKNMVVWIDGEPKNVTLPVGDHVSQKDILDKINDSLKDTKAPNTFYNVNVTGENKNLHFTVPTHKSEILYPGLPSNFSAKGTYKGDPQGVAGGYQENKPASLTVSKTLPDTITITGSNKHFACTLNGLGGSERKEIVFDLPEKTYTRDELVANLQAQINAQCGVGPDQYGGLKVSLNSANCLVFTAGLIGGNGAEGRGDTTQIVSSPAASSFLKGLYEHKSPASIVLGDYYGKGTIKYPVDFGGGQSFTFQLKTPSDQSQRDVTVPLAGSYNNGTELAEYISQQLSANGIPVKASASGKQLVLTTTEGGNGYELSFDSRKAGNAADSMFGGDAHKLEYTTGAAATIGCNVQDSFEIDASHNEFIINIDGAPHKVILDGGTYDLNRLVTELNGKLGGVANVSADGKRLHFETKSQNGTNSKIQIQYGTGGSSMIRIFGEHVVPGATASFNKDGYLEITRNAPGGIVQVDSNSGGPFQLPKTDISYPEITQGFHSDMHSYIQGMPVSLNGNGKVAINQWNKELTLRYTTNYTGSSSLYGSKSVTLDEGEYTLKELAAVLEAKLGSEFHVLEKDGGIRIEAANPGSTFRFRPSPASSGQPDCSGGFYKQILCSPGQNMQEGKAVDSPGGQTLHPAYVMGRKDIKHQITNIQRGVNDGLGMEFTLGGQTYPLSMTLDPGSYTSDALLAQVQEKLDEALVNAGLKKGLIEAGIGGFNTGVAGSNDDNALHFILSTKISLPENSAGRCVIEAVSGTAAFSIFYQTEGDISRAYIEGTKDLSNGVKITDKNGELSFQVDGQDYTVQIPPKDGGGSYAPDELVEKLNELLKKDSIPLSASIEDGKLHLLHTKFGTHTIGNISGSAKNVLFFTESGSKEIDHGISVQLSSILNDRIRIERPVVTTVSIGINSVLVSKTKYANKALKRLKKATQRISEIRSYFGSMQNRLEHAVNNNENKSEKTTSAESVIRDADMSRELETYAQLRILQQADEAMIAQANQVQQRVLQLLS